MISKLLWHLQKGLEALRNHTKFLAVIVCMFLFPLLVLQIVQTANKTTVQNVQTSQKETIALLHSVLATTIESDSFQSTETYLSELNEPTGAYLFVLEGESFVEQESVGENLILVNDFYISSVPVTKTAFIFEEYTGEKREWIAVSKFELNNRTIALVTTHDFSSVDLVLGERNAQVYLLLVIGFLFFFMVAYWLVRQTNWEAEYKTLQAKLDEQEFLITTITHEFRAPLSAITGYLSFLFESNRLRTKDKDSLVRISMSADRLLHLVNDFLEVAKIQSGNIDLQVKKVTITNVVYRTISELGGSAAEKNLVLRDATQDPTVTLTTDENRLTQILTNVINNAIKYTERGSVVITYEQNPLYVTLRVQDTGTGITAEDQKKLFMPFSRVGGVEKTTIVGSGLGMWITKRLVETLGGTIAVESIKGVGTHVVMKFDLRKIAAKTREGIL